IESEKNVGIIEHSQPGQRAARNSLLLFAIHCFHWPAKILAAARFHFNKYQRVIVTTDNVDFTAAATAEIAQQDFVTATLEVAPPVRKIGDGSGKGRIHGASGDAVRCRNLYAGRKNIAEIARKSHALFYRA